MTVEIVLLAMVALFVGLRLYAVLGQRTGHEQQPVTRAEAGVKPDASVPVTDAQQPTGEPTNIALEKGAAAGMRQLIATDPSFDTNGFLDGAQAAYRMILEAFWTGDRATLNDLVADDVREAFEQAIDEREAAGQRLENRLVGIERATVESVRLERKVATIEVRFDAYIASVTRDAAGEVVAGSLTDAIATHDIWSFRRDLSSSNPNWLLVETDQVGE